MSNPKEIQARRRFLKVMAIGAAAAPVAGSILLSSTATAADLPELDEADPTAMALGYKADASQVDASKFPQHQAGQTCAGCRYYQAKGDAATGPCAIFPGKAVHAKGWCSAFAAK